MNSTALIKAYAVLAAVVAMDRVFASEAGSSTGLASPSASSLASNPNLVTEETQQPPTANNKDPKITSQKDGDEKEEEEKTATDEKQKEAEEEAEDMARKAKRTKIIGTAGAIAAFAAGVAFVYWAVYRWTSREHHLK